MIWLLSSYSWAMSWISVKVSENRLKCNATSKVSFWNLKQYSSDNTYELQRRLFYFNVCIFLGKHPHFFSFIYTNLFTTSLRLICLCLHFYNTTECSPSLYIPQSKESKVTYTYVVGTLGKCELGMFSATPSFPCSTPPLE